MSASPSPAPFALLSLSSASCSPLGTPARMWSSVPASTAPSSPAPAPESDKEEDEEMPLKSEAEDVDNDSSPFLRGVPLSGGDVTRAVAWAEGDASKEENPDASESREEENAQDVEDEPEEEGELTAAQLSRLEHVLERSALYSTILKQQMDDARKRHAEERAQKEKENAKKGKGKSKSSAKGRPAKRRKRAAVIESDEEDEGDEGVNEGNVDEQQDTADAEAAFSQPALVTGARLKDYQLEGLQWMVGLHEQGISGILADEMGLGKTLQTIAFSAHLRDNGTRPFLVVCPLSVMHNWVEEFARFAPKIPVLMYHGTPAERAEMRRTTLALPEGWPSKSAPAASAAASSSSATTKGNGKGTSTRGRGRPRGSGRGGASSAPAASASTAKVPASPARRSGRNAAPPPASPSASASRGTGRGRGGRGGRGGKGGGGRPVAGTKRKRVEDDDEDEPEEDGAAVDSDAEDDAPKPATKAERAKKALDDAHDAHFKRFPVVITTYDLIIKDRALIGGIPWGYIVVDEGHRLKNMNCALMREIKKYSSAGRMVLTGTPLHNNFAELWSLLNFILPDIFDDVYAFQEWFSLPRMNVLLPSARMGTFISTLRTILKPFLLRRMKADVLGAWFLSLYLLSLFLELDLGCMLGVLLRGVGGAVCGCILTRIELSAT